MEEARKYKNYKWNVENKNKLWQVGRLKKEEGPDFWPFGNFDIIPEGCLAKTNNFEVKYWIMKKGEELNHSPKIQRNTHEYTFIIKGETRGHIAKSGEIPEEIILRQNDYIIIEPGVINNLVEEFLTDEVEGITIKSPSCSDDSVKRRDFKYFPGSS